MPGQAEAVLFRGDADGMNDETRERGSGRDIAKGIACCFTLNLLHLGIAWLSLLYANDLGSRFIFAVGLIVWFGVVQFVYVLPMVLVLRRSRPNVAKGMLIWACIVFLLCAACWGSISFVSGDRPWRWIG